MFFNRIFIDGDIDRNPVFSCPAGGAVIISGFGCAGEEAFDGQIAEAVNTDEVSDFFEAAVIGNQFLLCRKIDAVEAREFYGRAACTHMYFFRACLADCIDFAFRCSASDDGIIDDNNPFISDDVFDDCEFEFYLELAEFLVRRDKGPADIVTSYESHIEGYAALLGVSDGSGCPGIRDGDDDIGLDGVFDCESPAEFFSEFVDVLAENAAALFGEINVLEDAVGRGDGALRDEESAFYAVFVNRNDFARLDFSNEFSADCVEGAAFAGDDISTLRRAADA